MKKLYKDQAGFSTLAIIGVVAVVAVIGWLGFSKLQKPNAPSETPVESTTTELSPGIKAILTQKQQLLTEVTTNPVIIAEIETANTKNGTLDQAEIDDLDKKWRAIKDDSDPFITQFLTNKVAKQLIAFQEKNPGFVELFVTDAQGLNVGQTNKTSDYYQADEEWWTGAYADGKGLTYNGEIEYDESAKSNSIALYAPISAKGKVIGVLKAVLDVTAIQKEL